MVSGASRRSVSLALLIFSVGACASPPADHSQYLLGDIGVKPTWLTRSPGDTMVSLTPVGAVGGSSAGPEFGRVDAVAADSVGRMVVYDRSDCQMVVLGPTGDVAAKFGRCGNGPNEFLEVASLELRGDTLISFDLPGSLFVWSLLDGTELRRLRVNTSAQSSIEGFAIKDDSTMVAALNSNPMLKDGSSAPFVVTIDSRTGVVGGGIISASAAALRASTYQNESLMLCKPATSTSPLVVTQTWLLQAVVLDFATLRPLANHVTLSDEAGEVLPVGPPGVPNLPLQSRLAAVSAICGPDWYAVSARPADWTVFPPTRRPSLLELRSYDGRLLYQGLNPPEVHPLARPRAAWRDHLVFVTNEVVPQITVVRVAGAGT